MAWAAADVDVAFELVVGLEKVVVVVGMFVLVGGLEVDVCVDVCVCLGEVRFCLGEVVEADVEVED